MAAVIAHFNVARLRHPPGDPRVAEFTSNTQRVNAVAERSPGFIWRWADDTAEVAHSGGYQAVEADPCLAISLSVWESRTDLQHFVEKTVHDAFLRRRAEWFAPWDGPNYVIWPWQRERIPTVAEGWARLDRLKRQGPDAEAYGFGWTGGA